jgi:5-hydroxyisourate hydrolase
MKQLFLFIALLIFYSGYSQSDKEFQLSTHILDTWSGKPAQGVEVLLEKQDSPVSWSKIGQLVTDKNGRIGNFLEGTEHAGVYRLSFFIRPYFVKKGADPIYPFIPVVFEIKKGEHYHIPIVVTPYSYSTYRGS